MTDLDCQFYTIIQITYIKRHNDIISPNVTERYTPKNICRDIYIYLYNKIIHKLKIPNNTTFPIYIVHVVSHSFSLAVICNALI